MTDWSRLRDDLLRQLRKHVAECPLCDQAAQDALIHNTCDDGIVLLTEWFLAKQHAQGTTTHPPTTTEAAP